MYFVKLSGYGTSNPVLTDVYYILSKQHPTTKQMQNVLVKRGKQLHGPDRIYLNANSIIVVEPVGTHSKVAQLIRKRTGRSSLDGIVCASRQEAAGSVALPARRTSVP